MNINKQYCGYITITGKPNVGKSTILNQLIGQKISITSKKKNTTKQNIIGIKTELYHQYIYIDTPGINIDQNKFHIQEKYNNIKDIVKNLALMILVVDCTNLTKNDKIILKNIKNINVPIIIVINKIDKIAQKRKLLPYINFIKKMIDSAEIVPISAKKRDNIVLLESIVKSYLSQKMHIFPKNCFTTNSRFFTISEIIREKLIALLEDELPSIITVSIDSLEEKKIGYLCIKSIIYVKNKRQKKIVIGHNGEKIKKISILSRYSIEKKILKKVHLFLWVKEKNKN
ncbi:GTPase Era [Buchnera aphidicola (Muscaphis stroyani)]|uniref:GTPase Era n=1 Tax=Buchnera aphidicola (Muscaphis stroyani) TaxID=1241869 RepID=A0A4D6Y3X3_9GAMM|nr:GTPase Era [Buchnera aphidicola]QCI24336.1 GTPase Era [Buchnera aphidicola (Muscaphis stroyani)]